MYKLEFLPVALNDMLEISSYISNELKNPIAADKLSEKFVNAAEALADFPYSTPVYIPMKQLNHEYRKTVIENYLMFYWVDEPSKTVTVARIIYGKRNLMSAMAKQLDI